MTAPGERSGGAEVGPAEAGERLDRWLAARLPELSRTRLAALIREKLVDVNGEPAAPSRRLRPGDAVAWTVPPPADTDLVPEDLPLTVLHEDESLVVVDKPAGMVVHPGAGARSGTLVHALLHRLGDRLSGVGGERRPGIVHRLDKGTSGVMVVAKTDAAHDALSRQFAARTVDKRYLALTLGVPGERGRVDTPIGRSTTARTRMAAGVARGRASLTLWRRREAFGTAAAWLEVELRTGRTHQVRVHLASVGHPLVGDATYGGRRARGLRDTAVRALLEGFPRPALHAWRLAFDHPAGGQRMRFEAPVPSDLEALLGALRTWAREASGRRRGEGG